MGFILDGLDTESYDRSYSDRELVRRIISYFRPYLRQMIVVGLMIALNSAAGTGGPILISRAFDLIGQRPTLQLILLLAGGVLLMEVAAWGFNYVRQWFSAQVVGDVVLKLRDDVFEATIGHDLSFYDEHPSGKIVSRVTSDMQDFSTVATLVMDLLSQILLVVFLVAWLWDERRISVGVAGDVAFGDFVE
jgi:ATP-binding cassette, subfamily B, bacterial